MNILIIGGAGFLGVNLVRRCLLEKKNKITVLDSLDPLFHSTLDNLKNVKKQIDFIKGDMRDDSLLKKVVQGQELIFNCAAQTSHPLSISYPLVDAEINCLGNLKLLEALRLYNKKALVIYISSSTVIGKSCGRVIDENHSERPLEIYSANKGVAEKYYRIYHTCHDLKTIVIRFANLYGPYGKGFPEFGFINYFIHLVTSGKQIKIFGSGDQMRNVMYVGDAAELLLHIAKDRRLIGGVYFATSDEHLVVRQIAEKIIDVFKSGSIVYIDWPQERKRIEVESARFSSARLRNLTGWRPKYTFTAGLKKTREILSEEGYI